MNRRHRDPAKEHRWRQILRDWKVSGKSRNQFCRERGLSTNTFDYWRREIAQRDAEPAPASIPTPTPVKSPSAPATPVLLPVRIVATAPLEIQLTGGRSISVPSGFDPKHLRAVLDVLEAPPC
jgi:hypothetical protein